MKGRKGGRGFPVFRCLYSRSPESIHRWTDLFYRLSHYLFYRPMPACVYYDEGSKTTKVAIRNNGEYARDKYFIYIGGKQLMPIPTVRPHVLFALQKAMSVSGGVPMLVKVLSALARPAP